MIEPKNQQHDEGGLEYPHEDWRGFLRHHFGPSLLWALLGIGGSHIVLAPTMGSLYGLVSIWIILVIYGVKYGAWELGIRYNYGVGKNPIEGYGDLPGPKHWGQWLPLIVYLIGWTVILAAVGGNVAAFLSALFPGLSFMAAYLLQILIALILVVFSTYNWLENFLRVFVLLLALLIVIGVFISPPSGEQISSTIFSMPDITTPVFLSLFAAMAGYAPTGLSTTAVIGSWSVAKKQGARALRERNIDPKDERYQDYIASWIKVGRRDYNIGFLFSLVMIISMILLATSVLYPKPPSDQNIAFAIGNILKESIGGWTFYVIIIGAIAALYSTIVTVLDGASRVDADLLPLVLEKEMDKEKTRKILAVIMVAASILPILIIGQLPITLLVFSAALMSILQIFFYFANYFIVKKHLPQRFQPRIGGKIYLFVSIGIVVFFGIIGAMGRLGLVGG
ncbi:MAG: Nramp family divalent metal transporter [Spirochaetales bacterium]|nr:Nramp family divalent metal transporter [Spirochaetales bacterium]